MFLELAKRRSPTETFLVAKAADCVTIYKACGYGSKCMWPFLNGLAFSLCFCFPLWISLCFLSLLQGHVGYFCRDNLLFPFTFAGVNNFLQIPGYPRRNMLAVSFRFRTWDVVGLLMYTSFADDLGWLEMVLSDGQVNVTIAQPKTKTKTKKLEFAAGRQ